MVEGHLRESYRLKPVPLGLLAQHRFALAVTVAVRIRL
jgi:hypothetical protein